MSGSDILWQGWLLSPGKSQTDWKKRYFLFTSKQLSYHDDPTSPPKGIFEFSGSLYICWLKEGVNYCRQQYLFSLGSGSAPTLTVRDPSNIFVLLSNTSILQIACTDVQTAKIRESLRNIFRPCSVIAASEVFRKKNKFQWTKNFLVVLTSRDFILYENEKLDTIVARLTPQDPTDSVQLITGNEQNYKAQIEVKFGDKTVLLSAGSSQAGLQLATDLHHVMFFTVTGYHPTLPPPNSIAWNLPLITAKLNGFCIKGIFEREAVYQGIPEEIRPWVWEQLCIYLMKDTFIANYENIRTLVTSDHALPRDWRECLVQLSVDDSIRDELQLLCCYARITLSGQQSPGPICRLAAYLLKSLPHDTAIVVFQTLLHRILPIWLQDNYFQIIETNVFREVISQIVPDFAQWSDSRGIQWQPILSSWITSLFMVMNKQCVNRLWSVLLFEGYGALLPLIVSLIMSNRHLFSSPKATADIQSYLERDFLPSITSISDVMKNLRILVAPNQPSSRFFDIAYIKKLRSTYLMQHIQEFQRVEVSASSKATLLNAHLSQASQYLSTVDSFLQDVDRHVMDIRKTSVNDPDVQTQLLRLERISLLFHGLSPHVQLMEKSAKKHLKLVEMRRLTMLDAIDTISTVNQSTYCLPDDTQIAAILENLHDSQLGIQLIGTRADIISVLLAVQMCVWNLVSVGWELHEMRLRKAHTEMSWVNSTKRENIQSQQDYLSATYDRALGLDLSFAESLIRFLKSMKKELFGSAALELSSQAKEIYDKLQELWDKNSEEEELGKELSDLTTQTGYKAVEI